MKLKAKDVTVTLGFNGDCLPFVQLWERIAP